MPGAWSAIRLAQDGRLADLRLVSISDAQARRRVLAPPPAPARRTLSTVGPNGRAWCWGSTRICANRLWDV